MDLRIENGLLLLTCPLSYGGRKTILQNVLLDTGCAVSVFDIDRMECIGLQPNPKFAKIVKMYGVGGQSECCLEQHVEDLIIGDTECKHFMIQLGPILNDYGFDAILGNDFLMASGMTIDLGNFAICEKELVDAHFLN